jgi:hypothetical protein
MSAIYEVFMYEFSMILEIVVKALLGVAGAWVLAQLGKTQKLKHIQAAMAEVFHAAQETAAALQQTTVDKLKAAHEDGKLTEEEIADLKTALLETTLAKLSQPAIQLLKAAGNDIAAMIQDAAEAWIQMNKAR